MMQDVLTENSVHMKILMIIQGETNHPHRTDLGALKAN